MHKPSKPFSMLRKVKNEKKSFTKCNMHLSYYVCLHKVKNERKSFTKCIMHLSHLVCYEKWKMRGNHSLNAKGVKAIQYAPKSGKWEEIIHSMQKCIYTIQYDPKELKWEEIIHSMQNASKRFSLTRKVKNEMKSFTKCKMHLSDSVCSKKWKMRGNHSLNAICI